MNLPFQYWTFDHWMNFGIFLLGAVTAVGITASTHWGEVPGLFTPATTIGFLVSLLGFLRASVTTAARNPELGTRSTDPAPTERVVQVGSKVVPVPPVTPGRPVDPDLKEP
jgi:hypothetical protein